jgi:two-component system OmpR family sensor kinase
MAATTAEATTAERRRRLFRRRPVPVRLRITAAVVVLAGLALSVSGLVLYALELQRINRDVDQQVSQELDEFSQFAGRNPSAPQDVIRDALRANVPSPDELMLGFRDGAAYSVSAGSANQDLAGDPAFVAAVDGLLPDGGSTEFDTEFGDAVVAVKPVQATPDSESDAAFVLVHFRADEQAELTDLIQTYALVAGVALLALTAGAWSLSGRLLRPVRELQTTAQEISETDLTRRLSATGNDDLTDLTLTFNAMLDRLEDAFAGQREFLNAAGHELRTPLTIIRGHLELTDADDPSEVAATRELVLDEIDRMSRLIDELILLARSRRPDFVQPAPTDIGDLTDGLADKIRGLGERQWAIDARGEGIVEIDGQRVTQAVVQLAMNAYGHTTESDTVAVGTRVDPATVTVWVRDTGAGISVADQEHIFDRFYRSADSPTDGSGLGLSIVRAIADAHGGTVEVMSMPDRGATFALTLPRRQVVSWPGS